MCMWGQGTCTSGRACVCVGVRGQLCGVTSLLPLCGYQGSKHLYLRSHLNDAIISEVVPFLLHFQEMWCLCLSHHRPLHSSLISWMFGLKNLKHFLLESAGIYLAFLQGHLGREGVNAEQRNHYQHECVCVCAFRSGRLGEGVGSPPKTGVTEGFQPPSRWWELNLLKSNQCS